VTLKAVLFDIDGTLVDSNEHHVTAWQEAIAGRGLSVERQTIHDQVGKGADMLVPSLFPNMDKVGRRQLASAHSEIYKRRFLESVRPFPGARELLARTRHFNVQVVLASSASQAELEHYLELLDAEALVSATTSADDVARTKPAPDIFAAALAKLGNVAATETIVIGDTPYDMEAARTCGIAALGVRSGGFGDEVLLRAGASWLYDDVAALLLHYDSSPLGRRAYRPS
jgi:HAD superfamily hydrolase (TIGR01509 family)